MNEVDSDVFIATFLAVNRRRSPQHNGPQLRQQDVPQLRQQDVPQLRQQDVP